MKKKIKFSAISGLILLLLANIAAAQLTETRSIKNEIYELYAPNEKELKIAAEELDFAAKNFEKYFGEKPPKIAVYVLNSPNEISKIDFRSFSKRGLKVLPFISTDYLQSLKKPEDKKIGLAEARALSHEAGHKFLITYADTKTTRRSGMTRKYGHPSIPDWFDEAFATLCEFPMLQKRRYAFLEKNLDKTIPFEEFFKMDHPMLAKLSGEKQMSQEEAKKLLKNLPAGAKITIRKGDGLVTEKDFMFYSQSLALTDFLVEKKGKMIIRKIADGLLEGKSLSEILSDESTISQLESDWKSWVKERKN